MFFRPTFFGVLVGFECDNQLLQAKFAGLHLPESVVLSDPQAPRKNKTTPESKACMDVEGRFFEVFMVKVLLRLGLNRNKFFLSNGQ